MNTPSLYWYSLTGTGVDREDSKMFNIRESSSSLAHVTKSIAYYTNEPAFRSINLTLSITPL